MSYSDEQTVRLFYDDVGWVFRTKKQQEQVNASNAEFIKPFQTVWISLKQKVTKGFSAASSYSLRKPIIILGGALTGACILSINPGLAKAATAIAEKKNESIRIPIDVILPYVKTPLKSAAFKLILICAAQKLIGMEWLSKKIFDRLLNHVNLKDPTDSPVTPVTPVPIIIPTRINDWLPPFVFPIPWRLLLSLYIIFIIYEIYKRWRRRKGRRFISFQDFLKFFFDTLSDSDFLKMLRNLVFVHIAVLVILYGLKIPLEDLLNNREFQKLLDQNLEKVKNTKAELADMLAKQAGHMDVPDDDLMQSSPVNRYIYREFLKILRKRPAPGVVLNHILKLLG